VLHRTGRIDTFKFRVRDYDIESFNEQKVKNLFRFGLVVDDNNGIPGAK